jgi:membrane protein YqaA with SNARE-associated domain
MSKSVSKVKVPVSPDYRTAPVSFVENVIGFIIILAIGFAIILAFESEVLLATLMIFGALTAYVSVTIARNAR